MLLKLLVLIIISFTSVLGQCGVPEKKLGFVNRIIGGQSFNRGTWPWMVALLKKMNDGNTFFCGGVLISRNKVLTAAHCIQEKNQQPLKAREIMLLFGAYDLSNKNEDGTYLTSPSELIIHPEWNPNDIRYDADIAAIKLSGEVPLSKFIKPVCVGITTDLDISEGFVTGWGKTEAEHQEYVPKQLKVPIVTNEFCLLEAPEFARVSSSRTFCAGGRNNSAPCYGDSGGGIFFKRSDGTYFLKGLVSASLLKEGNCDVSNFALYTNVDKFIDWIDAPKVQPKQQEACGVMSSLAGLIQNGKVATSKQWPWIVVIFNKKFQLQVENVTYSDFEVGSLISSRHIIADAVFFSKDDNGKRIPVDTTSYKFYFGVTSIDDYASSNSLVLHGADEILLHPDLGKIHSLKFANFAVIKLKTSVTFSEFISPVCLSSFSADPYTLTGRFAYAVGHGYSETGKTKERKYSPMRIREKEVCDSYYEFSLGTAKNRSLYFCAGGDDDRSGCWSDHPLYLKQGDKWFLHAFVQVAYNKGKGCHLDYPVLYELAGPYYEWILNEMQ